MESCIIRKLKNLATNSQSIYLTKNPGEYLTYDDRTDVATVEFILTIATIVEDSYASISEIVSAFESTSSTSSILTLEDTNSILRDSEDPPPSLHRTSPVVRPDFIVEVVEDPNVTRHDGLVELVRVTMKAVEKEPTLYLSRYSRLEIWFGKVHATTIVNDHYDCDPFGDHPNQRTYMKIDLRPLQSYFVGRAYSRLSIASHVDRPPQILAFGPIS